MIGYKAFMEDLTCRGYQYEIGNTFIADGKIELCGKGFHFCKQPGQVFAYYEKTARLCEIEADGAIIEGADKCVCSHLTVVREIIGIERNRIIYGDGDGYGYGDGDGNGNVYGHVCGHVYGNGDGYSRSINRVLIFKEV